MDSLVSKIDYEADHIWVNITIARKWWLSIWNFWGADNCLFLIKITDFFLPSFTLLCAQLLLCVRLVAVLANWLAHFSFVIWVISFLIDGPWEDLVIHLAGPDADEHVEERGSPEMHHQSAFLWLRWFYYNGKHRQVPCPSSEWPACHITEVKGLKSQMETECSKPRAANRTVNR